MSGLTAKSRSRIEALRECASRGLSRKEAAIELGLSENSVYRYSMHHSLGFKHGREGIGVDFERASVMASMYLSGKKLDEIAGVYGVTRERVRQIVKKHHNLTGKDGGATALASAKRARAQRDRQTKCLREYGCSHEQFLGLKAFGRAERLEGRRCPIAAYRQQRTNAKMRSIAWDLSLWDWWQIWERSGKWNERGRGQGYMMCRFADAGGYAVGSVYIATGVHNGSVQPNNPYRTGHPDHARVMEEMRRRRPAQAKRPPAHWVHVGLPQGVTRQKSGSFQAQIGINGKRIYLGSFSTAEAAHEAYLEAKAASHSVAA